MARYTGRDGRRRIAKPAWNDGKGTFDRKREAQQTPVKIVFPMILCILPALFIIIVGPGAIRIFQSLLQG